jgi:hypothetical protein
VERSGKGAEGAEDMTRLNEQRQSKWLEKIEKFRRRNKKDNLSSVY